MEFYTKAASIAELKKKTLFSASIDLYGLITALQFVAIEPREWLNCVLRCNSNNHKWNL